MTWPEAVATSAAVIAGFPSLAWVMVTFLKYWTFEPLQPRQPEEPE